MTETSKILLLKNLCPYKNVS